jgi:flagellar hook-associated protein 2
MTTTSSTTSNSAATKSILTTLGAGSGIDTGALVESLVTAQFETKNQILTSKSDKLTSQISKVSDLKSAITDFNSALNQLTSGGTLATQPTSANTGIVNVTRLAGANLNGLSATLEVRQLAQSQVSSSTAYPSGASTAIGTGTLTLSFGTATVANGAMTDFTAGSATPVSINIDSSNNTLSGIATAINNAKAGVTASVLTDSTGARLVLKSTTGASQAFTLSGNGDLAALNVGVGASSTINTAAQDALVALDGVETRYSSNSIYNLISGARIDLVSASVGTKVAIGSQTPTTALTQAVKDFVETYNQVYKVLQAATDPISGELKRDSAAQALMRQLKSLSLTSLIDGAPDTVPSTLASIGVGTNRDGTLSLNASRLATVATTYPTQLEAIFAEGKGLTKALSTIAIAATSTTVGLGASEATYKKAQADIAEDQDKASTAADALRTRLTRQFAGMDAAVASYKATQSFLTQQIAAWNSNNN